MIVTIFLRTGFLLMILFMVSVTGTGSDAENKLKAANFEHVEEWENWKLKHSKSYSSSLEELEKHMIWLSNKEYIDDHNANSHIFGFTLAMNHLGDMVKLNSLLLYIGTMHL